MIRCAIIGLGRVASIFEDDRLREKPASHAGAIAANPHCQLVGGYDSDARAAERFSMRWNAPTRFRSCERMFAELRPQLCVIATYPDSHCYYLRMAMAHAVRVIICEKPLAHNLRQARQICRYARKNSVAVIVNHERRYSADWIGARDDIAAGIYGELLGFHARLYFGQTTSKRDMLWHDGCHLIDCARFLCGDAITVRRVGGDRSSGYGSAYVELRIASRSSDMPAVYGIVDIGVRRDHLAFEMDCSFERGAITIGNGIYRYQRSVESPYYEGYRSLETVRDGFQGPTGYFSNMVQDAVACYHDPARIPISRPIDAYYALRLISAITRRLA